MNAKLKWFLEFLPFIIIPEYGQLNMPKSLIKSGIHVIDRRQIIGTLHSFSGGLAKVRPLGKKFSMLPELVHQRGFTYLNSGSSTLNFKNGGPRLQRIVLDKIHTFK